MGRKSRRQTAASQNATEAEAAAEAAKAARGTSSCAQSVPVAASVSKAAARWGGTPTTAAAGHAGSRPRPLVMLLLSVCVFAVQIGVYWSTLCPTVGGGDSPELVAAAFSGGAAHPPGYPLWLFLNRAFFRLVGIGARNATATATVTAAATAPSPLPFTPASAANLLNAVLQAGAGTALFAAAAEWTGRPAAAALASLGLYAFADTTWTYAVVAEVFALNNLLLSVLLLLLARFDTLAASAAASAAGAGAASRPPHRAAGAVEGCAPSEGGDCKSDPSLHVQQRRRQQLLLLAVLGAWVSGLLLCNQHTSVLALAVLLPPTLARHRGLLLMRLTWFAATAAAFLAGLLPWHAYLAMGCAGGGTGNGSNGGGSNVAVVSWGAAGVSWAGFRDHLLRREYGTFQLTSDGVATSDDPARVARVLRFFATRTLDAATWHVAFALAVVGLALPAFCKGGSGRARGGDSRSTEAVRRQFGRMLAAAVAGYFVFFSLRANIDTAAPLLAGVLERFTMQSDVFVALLAAGGLAAVEQRLLTLLWRWRQKQPGTADATSAALTWALVVAVVAAEVARKFEIQDQSANRAIEVYGAAILAGPPIGSVLLLNGDLPGNAARYMQTCLGMRRDLFLLDLQMSNYDWYIPAVGRPNVEAAAKAATRAARRSKRRERQRREHEQAASTAAAAAAAASGTAAGEPPPPTLTNAPPLTAESAEALASFAFPGRAYTPQAGGYLAADLLARNPRVDFYAFTDMRDDDASWTGTHELWSNGLVKRLVLRNADALGDQVERLLHDKAWLKNALRQAVLPTAAFPLPAPDKYGPETWEYIVATTFRAAATELALFYENIADSYAGVGNAQFEISALRRGLEVYDRQFAVLRQRGDPTGEDFWWKNHGLLAHKLAGRLASARPSVPGSERARAEAREWGRVMADSWTRYLDTPAGRADPQREAIQGFIRTAATVPTTTT